MQNVENLVQEVVGEECSRAVPEISVYLVEGVGNSTRIDYGTGRFCGFSFGTMWSSQNLTQNKEKYF